MTGWLPVILALFCLVAGPTASGAGALRILAVEEPPVSFTGDDGKPAGYAVDVLREIQRRVGSRDPVQIAPESRVYATGLRKPNVVMLSFSRTPEREQNFHWIARIVRKPWVFYGRHDSALDLASLDDLRKLPFVAVVAGDVRAQWLADEGLHNLVQVENHHQAVEMLLAGRVDALFSEPQGVAHFCHVHPCGNHAPRALWAPRSSEVYILMSKPGTSMDTVQRWRAAADALVADGTLERIAKRWVLESSRAYGMHGIYRDGVLDFCADARGC